MSFLLLAIVKTRTMYKVLSLSFLLINLASSEVCSNNSTEQCSCQQLTNDRTHLPIYIAECYGRNLANVPDQLEEDLNYLDLSQNNIKILNPIAQELHSLHVLDLSYNQITKVNAEFFDAFPKLRELDLGHNSIEIFGEPEVFSKLDKLTRLDLSFNAINTLPDGIFRDVPNIKYLDLSYNYLGPFLEQSKSGLTEKLGLSTNLTHLSMDGMNISDLHAAYFDHFDKLIELSLADNAFEIIPTVPYSLEKLDLSGNKLTFLSARYLNYHSLKVLKLNRMPSLTDIHHYAFYNLYALEKLSLTDCPNLKEFNDLAFDLASKNYNLHPKHLSLARSGLETINETYKYFFKNMDHVDLRHNPWKCDCNILWLKEFESILYRSNEIRCNSPNDLRHKNLLELTEADLKDCHPEIYGKKSHRILIVILVCSIILLFFFIFYLMRYPSSWLGSKRMVGPSSPYSLASTSEHI